jgi:hypothetical protein
MSCRRQECEKGALRLKQAGPSGGSSGSQSGSGSGRTVSNELPCVCSVVAVVALAEPVVTYHDEPLWKADQVVQRCVACIASCIIQIPRMGFRKACQGRKFQGMVIGILYLCRTEVRVGKIFHMQVVPGVQARLRRLPARREVSERPLRVE